MIRNSFFIALLLSSQLTIAQNINSRIEKAIATQKAIYDQSCYYQSKISINRPKESRKWIRLFYSALKKYEKASTKTVKLMNRKHRLKL